MLQLYMRHTIRNHGQTTRQPTKLAEVTACTFLFLVTDLVGVEENDDLRKNESWHSTVMSDNFKQIFLSTKKIE